MVNLFVPCRAPYRVANIAKDDETVVLKVGSGDDIQEFVVPIAALCRSSKGFEEK
jgi:hypothetical protein